MAVAQAVTPTTCMLRGSATTSPSTLTLTHWLISSQRLLQRWRGVQQQEQKCRGISPPLLLTSLRLAVSLMGDTALPPHSPQRLFQCVRHSPHQAFHSTQPQLHRSTLAPSVVLRVATTAAARQPSHSLTERSLESAHFSALSLASCSGVEVTDGQLRHLGACRLLLVVAVIATTCLLQPLLPRQKWAALWNTAGVLTLRDQRSLTCLWLLLLLLVRVRPVAGAPCLPPAVTAAESQQQLVASERVPVLWVCVGLRLLLRPFSRARRSLG